MALTNLTAAEIDYLNRHGVGAQFSQSLGTKIAYLIKALNLVATKLDADAGVTDTNYKALVDAITLP